MKWEWLGIVAGWVGSGVALYQLRDARRARKRQESPHFVFDALLIFFPATNTHPAVWMYPQGRRDVPENYEEGTPVKLRAQNRGGKIRLAEVEILTFLPQAAGNYYEFKDHNELLVTYTYSKIRRGRPEQFRIRYETVSGEMGEQTFEFAHGLPEMKRLAIK